MSKQRDLEAQVRNLTEIKEIMNAMENLSLMEVHRLTRFLETQQRVVASIEAAATDFLLFHPELFPGDEAFRNIHLLVGSERGFCGDFNETLVQALDRHVGGDRNVTLVVIGSKLATKLAGDARVVASVQGASVVDEVDAVLMALTKNLTALNFPGTAKVPLRLIAFHHNAAEEGVEVSDLRPFHRPASKKTRFAHAPMLYLSPENFLTGLAEQYLFAELHTLLYSSLMAENQRRMQHLEGAVRRLERTTAELLRRRNTLRQEEITEEIEVIMLSVKALQ